MIVGSANVSFCLSIASLSSGGFDTVLYLTVSLVRLRGGKREVSI